MLRNFWFGGITLLIVCAACMSGSVQVSATTLVVSGNANVFGAGLSSGPPGGGSLPPSFSFPASPGQVLSFSSVTGTVNSGPYAFAPDGSPSFAPTDVNSAGRISGITCDRTFFLTGVFLGPDTPTNNAPVRLDFRPAGIGRDFASIAPALGQTFFIGDGLTGTGTGAAQEFVAPAAATRLFLGIVDAWDGYHIVGNPAAYSDDGGSYTAVFQVDIPNRVALSIWRSGAGVVLAWPAAASSCSLYQANAVPSGTWTPVTNAPVQVGSDMQVFVEPAAGTRFFCLQQ
jgi:hypothetical protein